MRRGVRVGSSVTAGEWEEEREGRGVMEGRSGEGEEVEEIEGEVESVASMEEVEVGDWVYRDVKVGAPTVAVGVMVPVGMEGKAVIESVDWEEVEGRELVGVKLPTEVTVGGLEGEGVSVESRGVEVEFTERVKGEVEVAEEEGLAPPAAANEGVGMPPLGETSGVVDPPPAKTLVEVGKGLVGAALCEPPPPPSAPDPGPAAEVDTDREGRGEREAPMETRGEAEGEMEGVEDTVARELAVGSSTVAVGVKVGKSGVGVSNPVKEEVGEEEGEKVTVKVGMGVSVTTGGVPEEVPVSTGVGEEVPPPPPDSGVVVGEGE